MERERNWVEDGTLRRDDEEARRFLDGEGEWLREACPSPEFFSEWALPLKEVRRFSDVPPSGSAL